MFQLVDLARLESDRGTILKGAVHGLLVALHLRISAALSCKESCLKENCHYLNTPTKLSVRKKNANRFSSTTGPNGFNLT